MVLEKKTNIDFKALKNTIRGKNINTILIKKITDTNLYLPAVAYI